MGDVVHGTFGGKPREVMVLLKAEPEDGNEEFSVEETKIFLADLPYYAIYIERVSSAIAKADDITDFISEVGNLKKNHKFLDLPRATMRLTPIEELCKHVLDSAEFEWRERPYFYGAAILELYQRAQVLSVMADYVTRDVPQSTQKPPE